MGAGGRVERRCGWPAPGNGREQDPRADPPSIFLIGAIPTRRLGRRFAGSRNWERVHSETGADIHAASLGALGDSAPPTPSTPRGNQPARPCFSVGDWWRRFGQKGGIPASGGAAVVVNDTRGGRNPLE